VGVVVRRFSARLNFVDMGVSQKVGQSFGSGVLHVWWVLWWAWGGCVGWVVCGIAYSFSGWMLAGWWLRAGLGLGVVLLVGGCLV